MSENDAILVIGGSGFIGQHLLKKLQCKVFVISRSRPLYTPENAEVFRTNIDDITVLNKVLPYCKWVFHLASDSTPGTTAMKPGLELELNLGPSLVFFEALQKYPEVNIIYLSSGGAVYGNPLNSPVKESEPLTPSSYYGACKVATEAFISALSEQSPRTAIILRPSNFYGPGQFFKQGFGVIPTIFEYQRCGQILKIWGDGENARDYLYIDDFIELCLLIIATDYSTGSYVYNVGTGVGYTLNQLCDEIEHITNIKIHREYLESRSVDVRNIVLDSKNVQFDFNWRAKTNLSLGLNNYWHWNKNKERH